MHQCHMLALMYDSRIPFDNDQAERDLLRIKVKQEISGRSHAGPENPSQVRGNLSTVRKNGQSAMPAVYLVFLQALRSTHIAAIVARQPWQVQDQDASEQV